MIQNKVIHSVLMIALMGSAPLALQAAGGTKANTGASTTMGTSGQDTAAMPSTPGAAQEFRDVESLNDDITKLNNKKVTVTGKVDNKIDPKAIVIQGGGLLNDQLIVYGPRLNQQTLASLKEDSKVKVTGTVRTMSGADFRREFGWSVDPKVESEIDDQKAFLLADEIIAVQ